MARVTRKDVAEKAGVTETIVSYVLNGNRYVDKDKKARVQAAIKELGYRPNPLASALKGKPSRHILFIADDLYSEYFGYIVGAMENIARQDGYIISLCSDNGDEGFVRRVLEWDFDCIVIGSATISNKDIQTLIDSKMPVVLLAINNYPVFEGNYGLINTGLRRGAEEVMKLFHSMGRQRIGYVDSFSTSNPADFRYIGYKNSLEGKDEIIISAGSTEELHKVIKKTYDETHFDALICRSDSVAAEVMLTVKGLGLRIPQDVAVVGFNNSRLTRYTEPSLSSVKIDRDGIASSAMELLKRLRGGEVGVIQINLETELFVRNSSER